MHRLETVCPNFSSTRNAYQAVMELLSRKVRKSKSVGQFFFPGAGIDLAPFSAAGIDPRTPSDGGAGLPSAGAVVPARTLPEHGPTLVEAEAFAQRLTVADFGAVTHLDQGTLADIGAFFKA